MHLQHEVKLSRITLVMQNKLCRIFREMLFEIKQINVTWRFENNFTENLVHIVYEDKQSENVIAVPTYSISMFALWIPNLMFILRKF